MAFKYLETKNDILGGKMCVKGTRISVDLILEWMSNGASPQEIEQNYPQIPLQAISEILKYAAELSRNTLDIELNAHVAA
jgi:uncharacterized protein (DUF433 family)